MKIRIIELGEEKFFEFRDHESVITIGRTKDCDIQLGEKRCSRKHCQINRSGTTFIIKDLDSSNGTIVNGSKIKESNLTLGDKIEIGNAIIFFGEPQPIKKIPVPSNFVKSANIPNLSKSARKAEKVNAAKANKEFNLVKGFAITMFVLLVIGVIAAFIYKDYTDKQNTNIVDDADDPIDFAANNINDYEAGQRKKIEEAFKNIQEMDIPIEKKFILLGNFVNGLQNTEAGKKFYLEFYKREQNFKENLHIWVGRKLQTLSSQANDYIKKHEYSTIINLYKNFMNKYSHKYYKPDEWIPELSSKMNDVIIAAELFFDTEIVSKANEFALNQDWAATKRVYRNAKVKYFKDIRSVSLNCDEKIEMIDRLLEVINSGQYEAPEELVKKITKQRKPTPKPIEPKVEPEEPIEEPSKMSSDDELVALIYKRLINCINKVNGNKLSSNIIYFEPGNSKTKKPISKADTDYLYFRNKGEKAIAWSDLDSIVILELLWKIKSKTAEDYWGMAAYAYSEDLHIEASEILAEFYKENKDLKEHIDEYMSKHIGQKVPKGGFIYHKISRGRDRIITPEELQHFENKKLLVKKVTQLKSAARKLERAKSDRSIELAKSEMKEILSSMVELGAEEEIGQAIDILRDSMKEMTKKAKTGSGHLTPALKAKLDAARNKALARIEDKVRYPDANHGIRDANGEHGQPWVDEAVDELKKLWADPAFGRIEILLSKIVEMFHEMILLIDPGMLYHNPEEDKEFIEESKKQLEDNQILRDNQAATTECCLGSEKIHVGIVNEYRIMLGRRAVRINPKLTKASRRHAAYLRDSKQFAHVVPGHPDGAQPGQRAKKQGYNSGVGENIAMNSGGHSAMSSFTAWYNSSGHHRNMVNRNWRVMGVGDAGSHWCQLFGGKEDGSEPRESSKSK